MLGLLRRFFAALPDAISASVFVAAWLYPLRWGTPLVGNLVLVMLLEFLLVHSSGFLGMTMLDDSASRLRKTLVVLGFGVFYMAFVLAFAFIFERTWAIAAFSWLLVSKLATIWFGPGTADSERQQALWGVSVVCYVLGAFVTAIAPLPRFGITPEVVGQLGLPGSGLWVEQPHTVMAFGALYFGMLAAAKWGMAGKARE
jgi:hypothetical protein